MSMPVTGRFAPTPSGRLHLGNILCCLLAYLSARSQGGRFLLRIEDVDIPRCPQRLSSQCIEDLRFLGFDWDEPPLFQSQRGAVYQQYFDHLSELGLVYPCFCTRAQLHAAQAPNLGDHEPVYAGTCAGLTPDEIEKRKKTRSPAMRLRVPEKTVSVKSSHARNLLLAKGLGYTIGVGAPKAVEKALGLRSIALKDVAYVLTVVTNPQRQTEEAVETYIRLIKRHFDK